MTTLAAIIQLSLLMGGDEEELARVLQKASECASYSFKIERVVEGEENGTTTVIEGKCERPKPCWLKSGDLEAFRQEDKLTLRNRKGWKRIDSAASEGKRGKKAPGQASLKTLFSMKMPHEELAGLAKLFVAVEKKAEKDGQLTVFACRLAEGAAKAMVEASEGRVEGEPSGTSRIWVDPEGKLTMLEIILETKSKSSKKGHTFRLGTYTQWTDVGLTRVDLPEGVESSLREEPKKSAGEDK
jgi:hypothetical protein